MLPVFWLQTLDSIEEAKQLKPAVFHPVMLLKVGSSQMKYTLKILSWVSAIKGGQKDDTEQGGGVNNYIAIKRTSITYSKRLS